MNDSFVIRNKYITLVMVCVALFTSMPRASRNRFPSVILTRMGPGQFTGFDLGCVFNFVKSEMNIFRTKRVQRIDKHSLIKRA